jgi:hypothetical protein
MKEWLIWRVGSGEQIKKFHDKWIPHEVVRMTYTPRRGLFEDAMVADMALLTRTLVGGSGILPCLPK